VLKGRRNARRGTYLQMHRALNLVETDPALIERGGEKLRNTPRNGFLRRLPGEMIVLISFREK